MHGAPLRAASAERKTGSQIYLLPMYEAICSWERFCTFAREPEQRKVGAATPRMSVAGVNYEVDPDLVSARATLYCVVKTWTYWLLMTAVGFHLPVSASDFGA